MPTNFCRVSWADHRREEAAVVDADLIGHQLIQQRVHPHERFLILLWLKRASLSSHQDPFPDQTIARRWPQARVASPLPPPPAPGGKGEEADSGEDHGGGLGDGRRAETENVGRGRRAAVAPERGLQVARAEAGAEERTAPQAPRRPADKRLVPFPHVARLVERAVGAVRGGVGTSVR